MDSPVMGFSHVQLRVRDVEASRRWYSDVLGAETMVASDDGTYVALRHKPARIVIVISSRVDGSVEGTTDVIRFPKRPHIKVRFFLPEGGGKQPDESPTEFGTRLLAEIRGFAPVSALGRKAQAVASR